MAFVGPSVDCIDGNLVKLKIKKFLLQGLSGPFIPYKINYKFLFIM